MARDLVETPPEQPKMLRNQVGFCNSLQLFTSLQ